MDRETKLGLLASAILEGAAVDWPAAESDGDPADVPVVQQLRLVAEIAALHRQEGPGDHPEAAEISGGPPSRWGHLEIVERVGSGSFGDVYRAWDPHLHREVALKLLRTGPAETTGVSSAGDPARVVEEGRLLARLRHPHVITVFGAEPRGSAVGLWMEFIRGRTLHRIVAEQGPLGAREAAAVGADLCGALAAVHAAGLVHRDVTARNVMREDGGRLVLMDFGAGLETMLPAGRSDRAPVLTGTPVYMAPELFAGGLAGVRTDIYAAGVLLFYLLTGQYPVRGRTLDDVHRAHRAGERVRLRDLRADLPAALVHAIEKATAPDPDARTRSAGELEAALDLGTSSGLAAPVRSRARHLLFAAGLVAAVAGALWQSARTPRRVEPAPMPAAQLTARRLAPPPEVWLFSNPSSDGRLVAGQVTATGDAAIVDLEANTYKPLALGSAAGAGGYATSGALSANGRRLTVDWFDDSGGAVWLVEIDGSAPRRLIDGADVTTYQWSADGALILAAIRRDGENEAVLIAASDGGVRRLRTLGAIVPRHMALSPDGRFVVYDAPRDQVETDHDLFVLDTHTGEQWPLAPAPAHDESAVWAPDGASVVFLSDRNRTASLWAQPLRNGRAAGQPVLLKDDIGRAWLHGFTRDGALHYQLFTGFAEVHLAALTGDRTDDRVLSPRQAVSNFYPVWSPDGRAVAFTSERRLVGRDLWVHDIASRTDRRVPVDRPLGRPHAWSPDGRKLLVSGPNNGQLHVVDRDTGRRALVARQVEGRAAWTGDGIVYRTARRVVVQGEDGTIRRSFGDDSAGDSDVSLSADGQSVLALRPSERVRLQDTGTGRVAEWHDSGILAVAEHLSDGVGGLAYAARRRDGIGEARTLSFRSAAGELRELLRTVGPDAFRLVGRAGRTGDLLVVRWRLEAGPDGSPRRHETLWRVPLGGAPPSATSLTMEGLRDVSLNPDGTRVAFNAGWKLVENWVLEHVLQ